MTTDDAAATPTSTSTSASEPTTPPAVTVNVLPLSTVPQGLVEALHRNVFRMVRDLSVQMLSPKDLRISDSDGFRIAERRHSGKKGGDTPAVADLAEQVSTLGLIHPVLLLSKVMAAEAGAVAEERLLVVSGRKRMNAAIAAQVDEIPCKVLAYVDVFPEDLVGVTDDVKDRALAEALRNLSYSESEHNTRLDDASVLSLLKCMRQNLGSDDWETVRLRLGLKSDASEYRNVLRLWKVACSDVAMRLLDRRRIRLRVAKKDSVSRVLSQPRKCDEAYERIERYASDLIANREEKEQPNDPTKLKAYQDSEIERIIKEVDVPARSPSGQTADAVARACEGYRAPTFSVKASKSRLSVPVVSIDFSDRSPANLRKVVEVAYQLNQVTKDIEGFLRAIKPPQANVEASDSRWEPSNVAHGERYISFLRERNLILYSNVGKVNAQKQWLTSAQLAEMGRDEQAMRILGHFVEDEMSNDSVAATNAIFAEADRLERERAQRMTVEGDAAERSSDPNPTPIRAEGGNSG